MRDFNKAVGYSPYNCRIYNNRAMLHWELKQLQSSVNDYTSALLYAPEFETVMKNLAFTYYQAGKFKECIETINRMKWAYQLKVNRDKVDTIFVRQDSIVINYWTREDKQLYQESINFRKVSFKKDPCKGLIVKRFFNDKEKPIYIEYWDGLCYDETEKEEDVKYYDARLTKIERVVYDKTGQITCKLLYEYQSYRPEQAYQITYWIDNGKQNQAVRKIDKYDFWD